MRAIRIIEEARRPSEEEESESVAVGIENLNIETTGTEEEAKERLEAVLGMEIEDEGEVEGEERVEMTQRELGSLEFLTQDAEPSDTTLVDACNDFNEMIRLEML